MLTQHLGICQQEVIHPYQSVVTGGPVFLRSYLNQSTRELCRAHYQLGG